MRLSKHILPQVFNDICKDNALLTIPEYSDATTFSSLLCTQDVLDQFLLNLNIRTPKKSCRFKFMTLPFSIFTEISS